MDIHKRFVGRRGTSLTAHGGTGASRTYPMLRGPIRYQFYSSPINIPCSPSLDLVECVRVNKSLEYFANRIVTTLKDR